MYERTPFDRTSWHSLSMMQMPALRNTGSTWRIQRSIRYTAFLYCRACLRAHSATAVIWSRCTGTPASTTDCIAGGRMCVWMMASSFQIGLPSPSASFRGLESFAFNNLNQFFAGASSFGHEGSGLAHGNSTSSACSSPSDERCDRSSHQSIGPLLALTFKRSDSSGSSSSSMLGWLADMRGKCR